MIYFNKGKIIEHLSYVMFFIGLASIIYFWTSDYQDSIISKNTANLETRRADSLQYVMKQKDAVKSKIDSTLKLYFKNMLNINSYKSYYSSNIQTYYLKQNPTLTDIEKEIKLYNLKYPNPTLVINYKDISISQVENYYLVYISGIYSRTEKDKPSEIFYQIKLDNDFKIFSIRNLKTVN